MEKPGTWVYTDEDKFRHILFMGFPVDTVYEIKQRGMNQISREFLNSETREKSLSFNYLIKSKGREVAVTFHQNDSVSVSQKMGFHSPFFSKLFPFKGMSFIGIEPEDEYGPQAVIPLNRIQDKIQFLAEVKVEYKGWSDRSDIVGREVVLVILVENENEMLLYKVYPLEWLREELNFKKVVFEERFSADSLQSTKLKAYVWNKGQKELALKSMEITVSGY